MRPSYVTLAALGNSPWIPLDRELQSAYITLVVVLSEDADLTYSVQSTVDPLAYDYVIPVTLARSAATVTATFPYQHGLTTGDSLIITGSGASQMDSQPFPQQIGPPFTSNVGQVVPWDVASTPSVTTLTYSVASAGPTTGSVNTKALIQRVFPIVDALTGATTRQIAPLNYLVSAVRLKITAWTAGFATLTALQGTR